MHILMVNETKITTENASSQVLFEFGCNNQWKKKWGINPFWHVSAGYWPVFLPLAHKKAIYSFFKH